MVRDRGRVEASGFRARFSCPAVRPVPGLPLAEAGRRTVGERAGGEAGCLGTFGTTHARGWNEVEEPDREARGLGRVPSAQAAGNGALESRDCKPVASLSLIVLKKELQELRFLFLPKDRLLFVADVEGDAVLNDFPTVRRVTRERKRRICCEEEGENGLPIHRAFKECVDTDDLRGAPVEIGCITAGKGVRLQWEWCVPKRTHRSPVDRARWPGR